MFRKEYPADYNEPFYSNQIGFRIGDHIEWDNNGQVLSGTIKYIGYLKGHKELYAGIEFENCIGAGTGVFNKQQLFHALSGHAGFLELKQINLRNTQTSDEHDKEQLILSLKLNISKFEQLPLDQLKPDDLKTAEKEIINSLKPEEAEPLLAKIQELRDAKRADDEARSAAHDNLVSLEKEAEDVTAEASAKKKKKDKKKSPHEMIDELSAKVAEAKALISKIEEAAKNEHLPADNQPKAEQLVSNLEAFVKDVEGQVSEKQDELDNLNNANDAIKRLGDALDDAEKTAVPRNVTALNEFKDRIAPHIATLVEAVQEVPVSVEPSAAALRDRAAKFVSDLEKNIQKTGDDEKRAEQLKSDVGNAVNNVDDVVSKYQNQAQPLDVAKEDANKLKTAVEQLVKLAESSDKIDPQVAKDIKDSKTKAKELLQALEKAIPQEDVIRREQAEIKDRLKNLEKELAKVDEFKPEDVVLIVNQLASDTTTLKAVTDSNNEKAVAPSSLISHDDLAVGLPEKVFQLRNAINDKKQALNKAAAVNEIAPKLQLVSQQLQSVPQDIPALPLDQLKPNDLKTAEKEITNSLKPEEAEPLLAKIQKLRDAKRADDKARSVAHENLVSLEKKAEDVIKHLIQQIEEATKNKHLSADDKTKAEQLVSHLVTFVKNVETQNSQKQDEHQVEQRKRCNEFKENSHPHIVHLVEAVKEKTFKFSHTFNLPTKTSYSLVHHHNGVPWMLGYKKDGDSLAVCVICCHLDAVKEWSISFGYDVSLNFAFCETTQTKRGLGKFSNKQKNFEWLKVMDWTEVKDEDRMKRKVIVDVEVEIFEALGMERKKFRKFDESMKEFSDVVLNVRGTIFYVSKLFLASQSSFFNELLMKKAQAEVKLDFVNPDDFHEFLELLHGEPVLNDGSVDRLEELAKCFDCGFAKRICLNYRSDNKK